MVSISSILGGSGSGSSKIVWMVGLGAVVAATVTWLLPKIEKPKVVVVPHPAAGMHHMMHSHPVTPATSPAAHHQAMGPVRDYNLSGLAIEDDTYLSNLSMEVVDGYPGNNVQLSNF
jgi:hypothetical protein